VDPFNTTNAFVWVPTGYQYDVLVGLVSSYGYGTSTPEPVDYQIIETDSAGTVTSVWMYTHLAGQQTYTQSMSISINSNRYYSIQHLAGTQDGATGLTVTLTLADNSCLVQN